MIKKYLIVIAGIIVGMILKSSLMGILYASHIPEVAHEIPPILYIAMGTNNNDNYAGWFNGLNYDIFEVSGYEPKTASVVGKQVIYDFVVACLNDPVYDIKFYLRKIGGQWIAPMYQSLVMNNNITGEQSVFARYIYYDRKAWNLLDALMNIYQLMIYITITFALIYSWKEQKKIKLLYSINSCSWWLLVFDNVGN